MHTHVSCHHICRSQNLTLTEIGWRVLVTPIRNRLYLFEIGHAVPILSKVNYMQQMDYFKEMEFMEKQLSFDTKPWMMLFLPVI